MMDKPPLDLYLIAPRGFCAGVVRAISIVEQAIEKWGAPVYVRHEIVHNQYVVDELRKRGAVFVEEIHECPEDRPVVLSAHGVAKSVYADAKKHKIKIIDAVCPLVSKVHIEVLRNHRNGLQTIMIGHAGHPETLGTLGQLPEGIILLVESVEDARLLEPENPDQLAYVTQTTLSIDDTIDIASVLEERFPTIKGPHKSDICYATTNRQEAVKAVADKLDGLVVVGSANSSNSLRLVEVGKAAGCKHAQLVMCPEDIDWDYFRSFKSVGLTAGASAPEILVDRIRDAFDEVFDLRIINSSKADENVVFRMPSELRDKEGNRAVAQ